MTAVNLLSGFGWGWDCCGCFGRFLLVENSDHLLIP